MNVLIACEESQRVCTAFRELGHEAYSCDLQDCSGGHPEWHIKGDVLKILNPRNYCLVGISYRHGIFFITMDGEPHEINRWDLLIAHPPCTYLTVTGNRWFDEEKYGKKAIERKKERKKAADFFMQFINANCPRIVVENPIGYMNSHYRKPEQIIHPWQFRLRDEETIAKSTCLWLKGVAPLKPLYTEAPEMKYKEWYDERVKRWKREPLWLYEAFCAAKTPEERTRIRSKTAYGIAHAMAEQWG